MIWALLLLAYSQPNPEKLYQDGNAAFAARHYARAAELYTSALRLHPENPEYSRSLGASLAAQGQLTEALPHLAKACRGIPRSPFACFQWGRTLYFLQRPAEALTAFAEAQGAKEPGARLRASKAQALDALQRTKEADDEFRHALADSALRPEESAEIQLYYGNFLSRQSLHEPALWQFNQALRKTPFSSQLWEEKAKSLLALSRLDDAAAALEQSLAHGPRRRELLLLLSQIYERLGQRGKAQSLNAEAKTLP